MNIRSGKPQRRNSLPQKKGWERREGRHSLKNASVKRPDHKASRLKKVKERQPDVMLDPILYLVWRGKKCNKE